MRQFVSEILEIVRPIGLRKPIIACAVLFGQAVMQLVAVLSVVPFLSAASDMESFRSSNIGSVVVWMSGDASDQTILLAVGLASLALLVIGNLVVVFGTWVAARYAFEVGHKVRLILVGKILARRYEYFTGLDSSTIVKNLVEDMNLFSHWVLVPVLEIFSRVVLVVLLILLVLVMEPVISLAAVATIALFYGAIIIPLRRKGAVKSSLIKDYVRDLYFHVGEILSGIKPILAGNSQRHFRNRMERASLRLAQIMPPALVYPVVPRIGFEMLVFGGLIAWVLVLLVTGGDLVAVMPRVGLIALVAHRLLPSLQMIFAHSVQISTMRQSMDEVLQLLREQATYSTTDSIDALHRGSALAWSKEISFEDVGFSYRGAERPSLHSVSFTIRKGQKVAFVGATGSGKSTLVDLLLGLLEPTEGRIVVDGVPLAGDRLQEWRLAVGYVPQEVFLLNASIAENIAFGYGPDELDLDRVREVAAQAHALGFIDRAEGYWANVGERGVRLSGGQRQRLAIARALYPKPSVLLLDEATSALDPRTETDVIEAIEELGDEITIVTVAHRLTTIEKCDVVFFLQEGRLAAAGRFDELDADVPAFHDFARARHYRRSSGR